MDGRHDWSGQREHGVKTGDEPRRRQLHPPDLVDDDDVGVFHGMVNGRQRDALERLDVDPVPAYPRAARLARAGQNGRRAVNLPHGETGAVAALAEFLGDEPAQLNALGTEQRDQPTQDRGLSAAGRPGQQDPQTSGTNRLLTGHRAYPNGPRTVRAQRGPESRRSFLVGS
ncbi:MAG: hypothetical protein JO345_19350 [Streptosporangiaceae bacterium]|nr:hypothetical protein [Streptosporangiaceae bacterium]